MGELLVTGSSTCEVLFRFPNGFYNRKKREKRMKKNEAYPVHLRSSHRSFCS